MKDPKGRDIFWVGAVGEGNDAGPGTDFNAIARNNISITPIQVDLTRYAVLDDVSQWIKKWPDHD